MGFPVDSLRLACRASITLSLSVTTTSFILSGNAICFFWERASPRKSTKGPRNFFCSVRSMPQSSSRCMMDAIVWRDRSSWRLASRDPASLMLSHASKVCDSLIASTGQAANFSAAIDSGIVWIVVVYCLNSLASSEAAMFPGLLEILVCPADHSRLELADDATVEKNGDVDNIVAGVLKCTQCQTTYPIVEGIPQLMPPIGST